jgi:N6-L-threonylcarbamoyladenine synthase
MVTLAIETSCDETGAAVVRSKNLFDHQILANFTATQIKTHAPYGGVVPNLAAREHVKNLPVVARKTLEALKLKPDQKPSSIINQVAYTAKPGLLPALLVGKVFAKTLALGWKKPVRPISHLDGHLYSFLLDPKLKQSPPFSKLTKNPSLIFPLIALIVSGGHTQLMLLKDLTTKKLLGQTRDDAAGEAFDKVARMLGLSYPGGPALEKLAQSGTPQAFDFPRPMLKQENFDFSFSGLKTAVLYKIKELKKQSRSLKNAQLTANLAASFQAAAVEVLVQKTLRAAQKYQAKTIVITGGVAANQTLRHTTEQSLALFSGKTKLFIPPFQFCADNAAMIGVAANIQS